MLWALEDHKRALASPGSNAVCPSCKKEVIPKCGEIVTWHWAHKRNDCDPWNEPESRWHIGWKSKFPKHWQEVVVGSHRADVRTPGFVIELQSSPISPVEIKEREQYYNHKMVWLLRGHDFHQNLDFRNRSYGLSFRWKWPRKSWWHATCFVLIDLPEGIFVVKKVYNNTPCGGWGYLISEEEFLRRCKINGGK